jgi:hypothetical protein
LDASGQPTETIKNKAAYHYMDAERYIVGKLRGNYVKSEDLQGFEITGYTNPWR